MIPTFQTFFLKCLAVIVIVSLAIPIPTWNTPKEAASASSVSQADPASTETPTPTVDIIPTPEPLPTEASPTPEPALEVTSTPEPALPVTITTTLEPALTEAITQTLTLAVDDSLSTPGGLLNLTWQLGVDVISQPDLVLVISVPPGFRLDGGAKGVYDPERAAFLFDPNQGSIFARFAIPADLEGPYPVRAVLEQSQGDGTSPLVLASQEQLVPETGLTRLTSAGGQASGLAGQVRLFVPPLAVTDDMTVRIRPVIPANTPPDSLTGAPFEILVTDEKTGLEIHEFKEPLTIEVPFLGGSDRSIF